MNKKIIELWVCFDNNYSTEEIEIEYENETDFQELADEKAEEFYTQLLENCVEYGWEVK